LYHFKNFSLATLIHSLFSPIIKKQKFGNNFGGGNHKHKIQSHKYKALTILPKITTPFIWSTFKATKLCLTASTDIFSTTEKSKKGIILDKLSIFIVWYTWETWKAKQQQIDNKMKCTKWKTCIQGKHKNEPAATISR
jgi:hypothetical protein